jgi:hypothetical protein
MTLKIFKGGVSLTDKTTAKPVVFDTEINIMADCEPLSPERHKKVISMYRKAFKKALKEMEGKEF